MWDTKYCHVSGNYVLQVADDFTYTDPVSCSSCEVAIKLHLNLLAFLTHFTRISRSTVVWHQNKVFGLFSLMGQESYFVYQYVDSFPLSL